MLWKIYFTYNGITFAMSGITHARDGLESLGFSPEPPRGNKLEPDRADGHVSCGLIVNKIYTYMYIVTKKN